MNMVSEGTKLRQKESTEEIKALILKKQFVLKAYLGCEGSRESDFCQASKRVMQVSGLGLGFNADHGY